jgi:hypothetical protein
VKRLKPFYFLISRLNSFSFISYYTVQGLNSDFFCRGSYQSLEFTGTFLIDFI